MEHVGNDLAMQHYHTRLKRNFFTFWKSKMILYVKLMRVFVNMERAWNGIAKPVHHWNQHHGRAILHRYFKLWYIFAN